MSLKPIERRIRKLEEKQGPEIETLLAEPLGAGFEGCGAELPLGLPEWLR